jgi:hypothetical protein
MIRGIKPRVYVTTAGYERLTDIGLSKQFLTEEVEHVKNEIERIDKELTQYNTTTTIEE